MIRNQRKEEKYILMEIFIKASGLMIHNKEKACINMKMPINIQETGLIIAIKAKDIKYLQMNVIMKVDI